MPVQTQIQVRRGTASSWTSTNPTLAAGEIGFETDTGKIKVGNGSSTWSALNYVGAANAIQYVYNATAGQTSFSGADSNGLTLSYTVGAEQVYVNGVLQVRTSDYTATNGTSVTLTTATIANDVVTIVAFGTFDIANTYTQAQANATFPLNTSSFFAGKNKIINGDFSIWQRGTSFTPSGSIFTADRWEIAYDGSGATRTISQQTFTPGTAPVTGYEGTYFYRYNQSVAGTGGTYNIFEQKIEDVRTFANQTVTVSFWAKADTTRNLTIQYSQVFGSGGSSAIYSQNLGASNTVSVTSSWQRFTVTGTIASISGKTIGTSSYLRLDFVLPNNTAFTFDVWGVQLEAGSVATAFETATGTIQGELAACQRYYWRSTPGTTYGAHVSGSAQDTRYAMFCVVNPVPMRVPATSLDYANIAIYDGVTVTGAPTAIVLTAANCTNQISYIQWDKTGSLTQYRPYVLLNNNNTAGYIGMNAEL